MISATTRVDMPPEPSSQFGLKRRTQVRMGSPHVTSFCCCFGLESGAKFVGFLHLLAAVCLVIVSSFYADKSGEMAGTTEDAGDHVYTIFHHVTIGIAVVSVGHVLLAATLLYGVYVRVVTAVRAWVWIMSALWILAILTTVLNCAITGLSSSGSDVFLAFLEATIFFSVVAYFILGVNSYFLMLKSSEDMAGPQGPVSY